MTEYATDPEAIQDYLNSRDRTANWVSAHSRKGPSIFLSPSAPPSLISDEDTPGYGPSDDDASSTHSLPPRMVLRYDDGRPDIPISRDRTVNGSSSRSRSTSTPQSGSGPQPAYHSRTNSASQINSFPINVPHVPSQARHAQSLSYATAASMHPTPPRSPESIRILPSRQANDSPHSAVRAATSSSHQSRTPSAPGAFVPPPPLPHTGNATSSHHVNHPAQNDIVAPSPRRAFSPPITHSQSQPPSVPLGGTKFFEQQPIASRAPSQLPYAYSPPAIVYAPSSKHSRPHYAPPAIAYSPSNRHARVPAPSITYSRSDPLPHPTQYSPHGSHSGRLPHHSAHGSTSHYSHRAPTIPEESVLPRDTRNYDRSHSRSRGMSMTRGRMNARDLIRVERPRTPRSRSQTPSLSGSDSRSDTSGSTYYVLPSPGQKVQIVVPNSASVYTASSTTKSAHSPRSPHSGSSTGSVKKPFFQRIFSRGSGSVDSRGSSGQRKRLHRRHTFGDAHLHGGPHVMED